MVDEPRVGVEHDNSMSVPLRLRRDLVARLWWGTGGGVGALVMAVLLGFSLVTNIDFYRQGEPASIVVFCGFCLMAAVATAWLSGLVELRETELVAGWRIRPQRVDRAAVDGVRLGLIEPARDEIFGIQLLVDGAWIDLRLANGLSDETQLEWLRTLSRWAGCEVSVSDESIDRAQLNGHRPGG